MKKFLSFVLVVAAAASMTSCAVIGTPVGVSTLYTDVQTGVAVSGNNVGKKVGTSSAMNVLGLIATGDASINTAANAGGIKKISHVDKKQTSILGLFSSYKTVVYGE